LGNRNPLPLPHPERTERYMGGMMYSNLLQLLNIIKSEGGLRKGFVG